MYEKLLGIRKDGDTSEGKARTRGTGYGNGNKTARLVSTRNFNVL